MEPRFYLRFMSRYDKMFLISFPNILEAGMEKSKDVLGRIEASYHRFSKGQKRIADYVRRNYEKAASMTAARLGETVGVSESTVVRFATELGYKGFPQFLKALQELVKKQLSSVQRVSLAYERLASKDDLVSTVIHDDIRTLNATMQMVDKQAFNQAVALIDKARKIYVVGGRSCGMLASFFAYYLSFILDQVHLVSSDSVTESLEEIYRINEEDVVVAISFPRYSVKTQQTMAFAKNRHARIIAITDGILSPLVKYADCCIYARSDMVSFVDSLVAPLSVINALLAAISMKNKDSVTETLSSMETMWDEMHEYMIGD